MTEEKRFGQMRREVEQGQGEESGKASTASRARNRTVMLTPEMTGQVRALLYKDPDDAGSAPKPSERPTGGFGGRDNTPPERERVSGTGRINIDRGNFEGGFGAVEDTQRKTPSHSAFALGTGVSSVKAASVSLRRSSTEISSTAIKAAPTSRVVGFMVSFDKNEFGEVFELRVGRWLVSSKMADQQPCIVIEDESVSPLHAVVRATKDGKIQVLDQLSEYGTGVTSTGETEERDATGAMVNVQHGDIVRFGERRFLICMIPSGEDVDRRIGKANKED